MSLHKSRASSVQISNQQSLLKQKLSTIDKHIRRSENLPDTFFMHPQLLEYVLRQPTVQQTNNQLLLRAPRSFLFHERQAVKFYFISTAITDDRRYVLKVQPSHIKLEVYVQVDGRKKVCYLVEKERGILIDQMEWQKAEFVLVALKKQKLSTVKVQMDTIIVGHKVKIHGIPSQRKIVEKELDQYLKKNVTKQKVAQILQKRKRKSMMLSRNSSSRAKTSAGYSNTKVVELHQTSRIFRSTSGFNESTSLIRSTSAVVKQPKIQQTQLKRDFNAFEQSKQKYLKHLQKMNPRAAQQIYENQKKYRLSKQQTLESVSSTAIGLIFMFRMLKLSIKVSKDRVRQIHVQLLCKKFMRNLMHANKIRMAIRSRNKVSMGLNLSAIASMMWRESKKKAQERIMSRFKVQLFMLDISKACIECENYIQKVITVQRKFRKDNIRYKMRFKQMSQAKGHTFEDQQHFNRLFEKYKKYCYTKSKKLKFGFTKFHTKIDELVLVKQ